MNDIWLDIYHRIPAPLRSVAASVRGYQLRSWRYGPETEQLVRETIEREHWTPGQWQVWRQERLAYILRRATTGVPFYREMWARRRRAGDRASWEYLENWPVLEKDELRRNPAAFVADGCDPRKMFHVHTSGTTGKPINFWYGKSVAREWYALFEARARRRYGVSYADRWANVGGQLIAPVNRRRPPFWVWNSALRQLYMSSYHLAPDLIPSYLDALARYRITFLCGYTSSLYELAAEALKIGKKAPRLKVVLTNAEPVFAYQRQVIEEAFGCPVRETYGMAEMAAGASECEHGRMHLWPEASLVETLDDFGNAAEQAAGHLTSTGLLNADMPLIRYRLGDRVRLESADAACACGRTLPLLASIEGRSDDVLYTADGRRIGRLDPVFKADLPLREAQVVQEALNRVRVKYVPTANFTADAGQSIEERLRARMGEVEVVLEAVSEIPRGRNGKFRAVVCAIPQEERQKLKLPDSIN